jgi:hypothetical protein
LAADNLKQKHSNGEGICWAAIVLAWDIEDFRGCKRKGATQVPQRFLSFHSKPTIDKHELVPSRFNTVDSDVLGLDVPMVEVHAVQAANGLCDLPEEVPSCVIREALRRLAQLKVVQVLRTPVSKADVDCVDRVQDVMELSKVRVTWDLSKDLDLAIDPFHLKDRGEAVFAHDFDCQGLA